MDILIDNRIRTTLVKRLEQTSTWEVDNQYEFLKRIEIEGFSKETNYVIGRIHEKTSLLKLFHDNNIVPYVTQPIIDSSLNPKQLGVCINDLPPILTIREHIRTIPNLVDAFAELGPLYYLEIRANLPMNTSFDEILIEIFGSVFSTLGPIDHISAKSRNLRGNSPDPDIMTGQIVFRNGIEGHFSLNALDPAVTSSKVDLHIYGTNDSLSQNIASPMINLRENDKTIDSNGYVFLKWVNKACRTDTIVYLKDLNS